MLDKPIRTMAMAATAALLSFDRNNRTQVKVNHTEKILQSSALIQRFMTVHGIPGLSIAISKDGQRLWSEGFGYSNVETGTPFYANTVVRIASISKPLTATIAAGLVQSNLLDLDKDVTEYVESFPKKKFEGEDVKITTRNLLSHTSGIRHYAKKETPSSGDLEDVSTNNNTQASEFLLRKHFPSVTSSLDIFKDDDLVSSPGTKFNYTTFGYTLVSAVLEKASGVKFPQLIRILCQEIGMTHTSLDYNAPITMNRCSYYRRVQSKLENCPEVDNSYKWAGGGLLSTVDDLIIFCNAILHSYQSDSPSNAILKKDTLKEFWNGEIDVSERVKSGLGWMRVKGVNSTSLYDNNYRESEFWYHTGGSVGASSVIYIRPSDGPSISGTCIAILCNLQDVSVLQLASEIETIFQQ